MVNTTPEFLENAEDLMGETLQDDPLLSLFDKARDQDSFEAHNKALSDRKASETLEQQNLSKKLSWGDLDDSQVQGTFALAAKGHVETNAKAAEAKKQATADAIFLAMLDDLQAFESNLEELYGENFELDILEELKAADAISDEEYERIKAIKDEDERREAIANATQKAIDDGRLDPEELASMKEKYPWLQEWLERRNEVEAHRNNQATMIVADKLEMNNAFTEAVDESSNKGDKGHDAKADAVAEDRSLDEAEVDQTQLASVLGGLNLEG